MVILLFLVISPQYTVLPQENNFVIETPNSKVNIIDWNHENNLLAITYDIVPFISIIDMEQKQEITRLERKDVGPYPIDHPIDIKWVQSGNLIANLNSNYGVHIWDVNIDTIIASMQLNDITERDTYYNMPASLEWSPDSEHIGIVNDNYLTIWNYTQHEIYDIRIDIGTFDGITWNIPDGNIRIVNLVGDIYILDQYYQIINNFDAVGRLATPPEHTAQIVQWNQNTNTIIHFYYNDIFIRNGQIGNVLKTLSHTELVQSIALSPDGTMLASSDNGGNVIIWDLEKYEKVYEFDDHTDRVTTLAWNSDGSQLASGSWDGTIRIWDIPPNN